MSVSKHARPDAIEPDTAASPRWLSIVGIGEDGVEVLSPVARRLIGAAEIVFAAGAIFGLRRRYSRRDAAVAEPVSTAPPTKSCIIAASVCVLASGDPFHYGVGTALTRRIDARDDRHPGAVGFQPGGGPARLVAAADALISVHGRSLDLVPRICSREPASWLDLRRPRPAALAKLLTQSVSAARA